MYIIAVNAYELYILISVFNTRNKTKLVHCKFMFIIYEGCVYNLTIRVVLKKIIKHQSFAYFFKSTLLTFQNLTGILSNRPFYPF